MRHLTFLISLVTSFNVTILTRVLNNTGLNNKINQDIVVTPISSSYNSTFQKIVIKALREQYHSNRQKQITKSNQRSFKKQKISKELYSGPIYRDNNSTSKINSNTKISNTYKTNDTNDFYEKDPIDGTFIRMPTLCKPDLKQFLGYLKPLGGNKKFFWFFEEQNSAFKHPLVIWLGSIPEQSTFFGLSSSIWPCHIFNPDSPKNTLTEENPYSLALLSNVLFIEQSGVGFSLEKEKHEVSSILEFIHQFFKIFPRYQNLDVHIAAESYTTSIASELSRIIALESKIKFKSLILGSPILDIKVQMSSIPNLMHENSHLFTFSGLRLNSCINQTINYVNEICEKTTPVNSSKCLHATISLWDIIKDPLNNIEDKLWNIKDGAMTFKKRLAEIVKTEQFLMNGKVQLSLFGQKSDTIFNPFENSLLPSRALWLQSSLSHLEFLLKSQFPILIYTGDQDFLASPLAITTALKSYQLTSLYDSLKFIIVSQAGHLPGLDRPDIVHNLLRDWLQPTR